MKALVFIHGLQALADKAFREFPLLSKHIKSADRVWMSVVCISLEITHRLLQILRSARMNKSDLVDAIADSAGLSKADAGRAVDSFVSTITGALQSGQAVSLVGFGTFSVRDRAARTGRNPRTGETIQIAKDAVN
jgi:DNA-binding protein HU-beta